MPNNLYDIKVVYHIEFYDGKPSIEGVFDTVALNDYDAVSWVGEYWRKRYPHATVTADILGGSQDPFLPSFPSYISSKGVVITCYHIDRF